MNLSLRTVIFLCTLLLERQFEVLVHAGEHLKVLISLRQLWPQSGCFDESSMSTALVIKQINAQVILRASGQIHLGPTFHKYSRLAIVMVARFSRNIGRAVLWVG